MQTRKRVHWRGVLVSGLALCASATNAAGEVELRCTEPPGVPVLVVNSALVDEDTLSAAVKETGRIFRMPDFS